MLRNRENSDVFNSLDEIYLVFTSKKQISSIYFVRLARACISHQIIHRSSGQLLVVVSLNKAVQNAAKVTPQAPQNHLELFIFVEIFYV